MAEIFLAALPPDIQSLIRSEIAPHVFENSGAIVVQCWSPEGANVLEALRPSLEPCLPSGYGLTILDGQASGVESPDYQG